MALLPVMQEGMANLMDSGAYCTHLAHALLNEDDLPRIDAASGYPRFQRRKFDGHGRCAAQGLHKRLIVPHITGQIGGEAGEGCALRLVSRENFDRLE